MLGALSQLGCAARKRNDAVVVIRPQADAGLFTDKLLVTAPSIASEPRQNSRQIDASGHGRCA